MYKIYTTIDGLGGRACGDGWAHGRINNKGQWIEIEYKSEHSALRSLKEKQFHGKGAYATNGRKRIYAKDI
jgi:hypothetical protein